MAEVPLSRQPQSIPFWRDVRKIAIMLQIAFVIAVVLVIYYLYNNMQAGLQRSNLTLSFNFLQQAAGMAIGEGPAYSSTDSYLRAFYIGIANTLRVSVSGVILATILGVIVGVSRLSNNWLLRNITYTYIEIIRNTPLLLQLFFWFLLISGLPRPADALQIGPFSALSNRGIFLAWPRGSESFGLWLPWLIVALVVGVGIMLWRRQQLIREDRPGAIIPWGLLGAAGVATLGFLVTLLIRDAPLFIDFPVQQGFNYTGGISLTAPFSALLIGLVTYTAAFIGEVVRAGIQAVGKGQREAAKALGLTDTQSLRLIVLPQALRVIIPPLTNQYLNLTKNSSLAIAIAYPDLTAVGFTMINQSGQTVVILGMIMLTYLSFSLVTSLFMNWYNRRIQLVER